MKEDTKGSKEQTNLVDGIVGQMKDMVAIRNSFEGEQLKFVKNLINPKLTDTELYMFLSYAGKSGLNPFNKEIIAVVYDGNNGRVVNSIVTRDGKRATAYRQGGVEDINVKSIYIKTTHTKVGEIETDETKMVQPWEGGKLWGATCTVKRNGKEYTTTVSFNEYNTGKNQWAAKPETMIKKVAESQALSMAVPELLGIYDESEMPSPTPAVMADDDNEPATETQIKTVQSIADRQGVAVDVNGMTKGQYKKFVVEATTKK